MATGQVCMDSKLRVLSTYSCICVQLLFPQHYYPLPARHQNFHHSSTIQKRRPQSFPSFFLRKSPGKIKLKMQPTGCMITFCMDCLKGSNACKTASLQKYLPRKIREMQKYLLNLCCSDPRKTVTKTDFFILQEASQSLPL